MAVILTFRVHQPHPLPADTYILCTPATPIASCDTYILYTPATHIASCDTYIMCIPATPTARCDTYILCTPATPIASCDTYILCQPATPTVSCDTYILCTPATSTASCDTYSVYTSHTHCQLQYLHSVYTSHTHCRLQYMIHKSSGLHTGWPSLSSLKQNDTHQLRMDHICQNVSTKSVALHTDPPLFTNYCFKSMHITIICDIAIQLPTFLSRTQLIYCFLDSSVHRPLKNI